MTKKFSASQMWTVVLVLLFGFNIATTSAAPENPRRNGSSGNATNSFINDNFGLYLLCRGTAQSSNLKLQGRDMPADELPRLTNATVCQPGESSLTFPSQYSYCPGCKFSVGDTFNFVNPGANFGGSSFTSNNLSNLNFKGSNFASAVFSGVNFTSAILTATNFSEAWFTGDTGNDLSSANFAGANFQGARLDYITATNANFTRINGYVINLNSAKISGSSFFKANLSQAILAGADMQFADLESANLSFASADAVDWRNAQLPAAYLYHSLLNFAKLDGANLNFADLTRADLRFATGVPTIVNTIFDNTTCPNGAIVTSPAVCTFI